MLLLTPKRLSAVAFLSVLVACQPEPEAVTPEDQQLEERLQGMTEAERREWKRERQERLNSLIDKATDTPVDAYQENSVRQFPRATDREKSLPALP